jgi:predicted TIM-barrel fold metal-dependent hydrolase
MKNRWIAMVGLMTIFGGANFTNVMYAQQNAAVDAESGAFTDNELQQFAALNPIDTHTHIYKYDSLYVAMLQKLHLHILDIMDVSDNANPERKSLAKESRDVFDLVDKSSHQVFACTTFDPYLFNDPDFAKTAIRELNRSFDQGALAVKVWKNIGMQVKDAKGAYILPDNPALQPIYRDIAAHHKTLITHIADPDTAWLPPNPEASDMSYFVQHPEWYMYKIKESPSKEQILHARDHVLEANPDLRMVGAHFGSMEGNFAQLAEHLDRYPNFAVDMASRVTYLMKLPRSEAIAFILKYQDRLIYGTDDTLYPGADAQQMVKRSEAGYARDWLFFATDKISSNRGREVRGLALPESVLRKIYHENAVHWFSDLQ